MLLVMTGFYTPRFGAWFGVLLGSAGLAYQWVCHMRRQKAPPVPFTIFCLFFLVYGVWDWVRHGLTLFAP